MTIYNLAYLVFLIKNLTLGHYFMTFAWLWDLFEMLPSVAFYFKMKLFFNHPVIPTLNTNQYICTTYEYLDPTPYWSTFARAKVAIKTGNFSFLLLFFSSTMEIQLAHIKVDPSFRSVCSLEIFQNSNH